MALGESHLKSVSLVVNGDSGHRFVCTVQHDESSRFVRYIAFKTFIRVEFVLFRFSRPFGNDITGNLDYQERGYPDQREPGSTVKSEVILHPTIIHGLPAHSVAKLLAPKPALCGQDLEVTINDLTFLGHPLKFDIRSLDEDGEVKDEQLTSVNFVFAVQYGCR